MKIFTFLRRSSVWAGIFLALTAFILVACGNGEPTPAATRAATTAAPNTPVSAVTPQPDPTATLSPTATTAPEPTATSVPTPTSPPTSTVGPTATPAPTAVPAATAVAAATATPAPTSTPTPEPTATPLPEPTAIPEQFTNVDELGFSLRLDGSVDVQSAGWTEAEPSADQGRISFEVGGVNAILIWSPAGDQRPLNFLADTYNILRASQPDITFEPATEGQITVSQQEGIFGAFTTTDASGSVLGGGLIATWLCPGPGTAYRLTVTGTDSGVTQIRFDRLVDNFVCGS